jgi:hypothetical protein
MNELIIKLREFQQDRERQNNLEESFKKLAFYLLYGGYFNCSKRYDLYITSIEFYYHEENGDIKDPIVYHRNKKKWNKKTKEVVHEIKPYFEIGTLNLHMSGIDITFEKKDKYRASALIRAFRVYDKIEKVWLDEDGRSTYVYEYLFDGLSVDKSLTQLNWMENKQPMPEELSSNSRKNVFQYVSSEAEAKREGLDVERLKVYDFEYYRIETKPCERKWRFSRPDGL